MFGLDLLGVAKFAKVAKDTFPGNWALGCLSSAFGDARPAVEAILRTGKCPRVRVHLLWKDDHSFTASDYDSIAHEAEKWKALVVKYPKIQWYFSPACEPNWAADVARQSILIVSDILPGCTYVNNSNVRLVGPNIVTELHGPDPRSADGRYIFSFDNAEVGCVDLDVSTAKRKLIGAEMFFFWEPRFNGRWECSDTTPRPLRTGWPDSALIRSVVTLSGPRGKVRLPRNWLWKSHAENHGSGDNRAEKPVCISPVKTDALRLKRAGKTVMILPYYGPYTDGRHRYYAPKMGFQISKEPLELWANRTCYGTVNPSFRQGVFR